MNLFAVAVVADPSRAEAVRRAVVEAHRATSPFADHDHVRTVWQGRHTVAGSFSIHAATTAIGAYAHSSARSFDTFSGLPRFPGVGTGGSWASALASTREAGTFDPRDLGGVWSVARVTDDEVEVTTSSTGSEPILVARRPGLVVLGNRASLVRLTAWPEFPIAFDTDALTTLCSRGWLAHDRIPFSGLELLPPGARARVRPDGVTISRSQRLTEMDPVHDAAELDEVYSTIAQEMVTAAGEVARIGPRPRIELTGDVNTRLSAAVYAAANVDAVLITPHAEDEPDAQVAAEVAARIGMEHRCEPVGAAAGELVSQMTVQVRQGEGTSNVFDPCSPKRDSPHVEVVRHACGALLGGYDNLVTGPRPPVTSVEEGQRFLDALALHNATLLLRDEARTAQQQTNRRTAEELLDEVGPLSFHELAYLRLREGRGTGANRQAAGYGALQAAPTLDDRVLRHLGAIPLEEKRSQRAVFALVRRLAPELASVPFVGSRWRFEADGPTDMFDPDGWSHRAPVRPLKRPGRSERWRTRTDGSLLPQLVRRLSDPDPLLDEIVDRRRVHDALRREPPYELRDLRSLFGALTAKHLLGRTWLPSARAVRRTTTPEPVT